MSDWREQQKAEKFERDPENGCIVGSDGCHYDSRRATLHFAKLHLCGCGCPEDAYNFCREVLMAFDRRESHGRNGKPWIMAEDVIKEIVLKKPDVAAHVLSHVLNHFRLLEHGGSVGGSWCTESGHQIVDLGPATEADFDPDAALSEEG